LIPQITDTTDIIKDVTTKANINKRCYRRTTNTVIINKRCHDKIVIAISSK